MKVYKHLLSVVTAAALLPLVPLLASAVSGEWRYPVLVPQELTSRGLQMVFDPRSEFVHGLLTSTVIATAVAVLACIIGFPAGRALGLHRFRGRGAIQYLLLAPVIVPGLAVTLGIQIFFVRYGLADSMTGVVLVHLMPSVPYATIVFAGAFANFDTNYERQARVLGLGPVKTLLFVTVPLLAPAIAIAGLFAFLISWSEYVLTLLIGGGQVKTLPLLLFAAIGSSDTTTAAALALVVVIPPLVLVAIASRLILQRTDAVVALGRL